MTDLRTVSSLADAVGPHGCGRTGTGADSNAGRGGIACSVHGITPSAQETREVRAAKTTIRPYERCGRMNDRSRKGVRSALRWERLPEKGLPTSEAKGFQVKFQTFMLNMHNTNVNVVRPLQPQGSSDG
jgi:hypothetical protein